MKKRKTAAVLFLLAALLSAAVSCGETDEGEKDSGKPQDSEIKTTETEPVSVPENAETVLAQFSQPDYAGTPIRILTTNSLNGVLNVQTAPDETLTGDLINEALFERDRRLEDYFNSEIKYVMAKKDNDLAVDFKKSTLASETEFDFMIGGLRTAAIPSFNEGLCANLSVLPEIDLSKPWWSGNVMENLVINHNFFMLVGEFSPRNVMSGNLLIFNLREWRDQSLPSLYEMVDNGTWTMDAFETILKDTAKDLDGDGKIESGKDFFGMNCDSTTPLSFYFGMGEKMLSYQNGTLSDCLTTDQAVTVLERIKTMYASGNLDGDSYLKNTYAANDNFMDNKALFNCMVAIDLTTFRESETDYGIVPLPKYDESQKGLFRRRSAFRKFRNDYLAIAEQKTTAENLEELNDRYDCLISGGDQIWNLKAKECDPAYFFPVKHVAKKIAYAVSLNTSNFQDSRADRYYREWAGDYDYISIREEAGKERLSSFLNGKVAIHSDIDPVFLIDSSEFLKITSPRLIPQKYIFLYTVKCSEDVCAAARKLSEKFGLPVITIFTKHIRRAAKYGIRIENKRLSPCDFLSFLYHAELVVTDSFHRAAFSVVFNKELYCINITTNGVPNDDERLSSLLQLIGHPERFILSSEADQADCNAVIDYDPVNETIRQYKQQSAERLLRAING